MAAPRAARAFAALFLVFLPLALFHRPLSGGEAFLPADLLGYVAPWKTDSPPPAAWNVLRYDGITQFYPWRLQAARALRAGQIPLWNPYAFASQGGTPLLANSQSAPLYPPNWLFALVSPKDLWYIFGLSAALHLLVAAAGTYRFLRAAVRVGRPAALLGAVTFALSGPVITWLALPTFLAVSCWLPWLLFLIHRSFRKAGTRAGRIAAIGAGTVAGLTLLAGHLQIAFYVLLASVLYAVCLALTNAQTRRTSGWIAGMVGAGLLALALASPQLLPSIELSRVSHRAIAGPPTMELYSAYLSTALPLRNVVTLLVPNFFGHPNPTGEIYWNTNNYAEWAMYIGAVPLLLGGFALALPWRQNEAVFKKERLFFAGLALLAILIALGTPANWPFFFLVPGYRQTGNPARILILWAFAGSALAAIGLEALSDARIAQSVKARAAFVGVVAPTLITAIGASLAAQFQPLLLPTVPFGALMAQALPDVMTAVVLVVLGAVVLFLLPRQTEQSGRIGAAIAIALTLGELLGRGVGYNPGAKPGSVYSVTPGITYLQENGKNVLVAALNRNWSLGLLDKKPPRSAVLPPNALTVYGLHDVGGYDSLFYGESKEAIRTAGQGEEPSPPENGNMVFVKRAETAVSLGARFIVVDPETPTAPLPDGLIQVYAGPDMRIYENRAGRDFDTIKGTEYAPTSLRIGLFTALCGLAFFVAVGVAGITSRLRSTLPGHPQHSRLT